MDKNTIKSKLGSIDAKLPTINLEQIISNTYKYFDDLEKIFEGMLDPTWKEIAIIEFTKKVYQKFMNQEFLAEPSESLTTYSPEKFLQTTRELSLELSNSSSFEYLYSHLMDSLDYSDKFIYRLIVQNLGEVFKAYKRLQNKAESPDEKTELKNKFTEFTLKVLERAKQYSEREVKGKWDTFEKEFNQIKSKYFPEEKEPFNLSYLLKLAKMNLDEGVKRFQSDYGNILCVAPKGAKKERDKFGFKFWIQNSGRYAEYFVRTGENFDRRLPPLLFRLMQEAKLNNNNFGIQIELALRNENSIKFMQETYGLTYK